MRLSILSLGLIWSNLNIILAKPDKEHVHIKLKIPKLVRKHTHMETKYVHVFHPVHVPHHPPPPPIHPPIHPPIIHPPHHHPAKLHGFRLRNDPASYNVTTFDDDLNFHDHRRPHKSSRKIKSSEMYRENHKRKTVRKPKHLSVDDYSLEDFPSTIALQQQPDPNVKYYILDAHAAPMLPQGTNDRTETYDQIYITTEYPMLPTPLPIHNSHKPTKGRFSRIPPPISQSLNHEIDANEFGKTRYWKGSGKGKKILLHKRKPHIEPSESKRTKITILPKNHKPRHQSNGEKTPFLIKWY